MITEQGPHLRWHVACISDSPRQQMKLLNGRLLKRDIFKAALNLGPFLLDQAIEKHCITFKRLVEDANHNQGGIRAAIGELSKLLQQVDIRFFGMRGGELKRLTQLVDDQHDAAVPLFDNNLQ